MGFYKGHVPLTYKTDQFVFKPLTPEYTQFDYDALMASKSTLRDWSGSSWPRDDFTLNENRNDLQGHADEFEMEVAYAYTILNSEESRVEGCFYCDSFFELLERFGVDSISDPNLTEEDALVRFWIREEKLDEESELLDIIIEWLKTDWEFPNIYFATNTKNSRQAKLFEDRGMEKQFEWSFGDVTWGQYLLED